MHRVFLSHKKKSKTASFQALTSSAENIHIGHGLMNLLSVVGLPETSSANNPVNLGGPLLT